MKQQQRMYRRLKREKERQEAYERVKAKEKEEKKEDPPVDENGVIEHKVDFLATLSDKAKSNASWDEEDSCPDYGDEYGSYDDSDDYFCSEGSDIEGGEGGVIYDIDGNVIPQSKGRPSSSQSAL